jgi:hypothetical protein
MNGSIISFIRLHELEILAPHCPPFLSRLNTAREFEGEIQ